MLSLLFAATALGTQQPNLAEIVSRPIAVERPDEVDDISFDWRMSKIFVEASIEGQSAEFIFDTGSPTMISRALADTLELTYVGQNTGRDANGTPVTMDIALVDTLTLGQTVFRQVPVMVFDFSALPNGQCLIDGGIIGSEIFAGSAWQIDLDDSQLRIAVSADSFDARPVAYSATLTDFGYPHAPIINYAIGDLEDRALFDTGSPEVVALFEQVADSRDVRRRVDRRSVRQGEGYEGESAGGLGQARTLVRASFDGLELGEGEMDAVRFATRSVPPTLLGAGLLRDYVITMDYPGGALTFSPRERPEEARVEAGYGLSFTGDSATVVQLFEGSQAEAAGLRLGTTVHQVGSRRLDGLAAEARCEAVRWLAEDFDPSRAQELLVEWDGQTLGISVPETPRP